MFISSTIPFTEQSKTLREWLGHFNCCSTGSAAWIFSGLGSMLFNAFYILTWGQETSNIGSSLPPPSSLSLSNFFTFTFFSPFLVPLFNYCNPSGNRNWQVVVVLNSLVAGANIEKILLFEGLRNAVQHCVGNTLLVFAPAWFQLC